MLRLLRTLKFAHNFHIVSENSRNKFAALCLTGHCRSKVAANLLRAAYSSQNAADSYKSTKSFEKQALNETEDDSSSSQSSSDDENEDMSNEEYEKNVQNKILEASLPFVHTYGWSKDAITEGAKSIGYPGVITEMFPLGASSLVLYFYEKCNRQLGDYLKSKTENALLMSHNEENIKAFIAEAIEVRLRMIVPYIEKWPQAVALLTTTRAAPNALKNLMQLVDDIAHYAGDRSVNLDWYIRRIGIAGIYKMTELHMLQDKSPNYQDSWSFLQRQLDDAVTLYSYLQKSDGASQFTKDLSSATIATASNMLGLKWHK